MQRAHQARLDAIRAETDDYIKSLTGEADEPAPTDVDQARAGVSAPGSTAPAAPGGSGPGRPINPRTAELEEAERIRSMSVQEYAQRRAEFGVRSPTDMNRLGKTR